jgi:hypothetical protein
MKNMETVKLDPFTFGNSQASVNLVSMLNDANDVSIARTVLKVIQHYIVLIKFSRQIEDLKIQGMFLTLIRDAIKSDKRLSSLTGKIQSHTYNVVRGRLAEANRKRQQAAISLKSAEAKKRHILKKLKETNEY